MTITQLEYILALDRYRHYVTASKHCQVTQPALTAQVKKLEEELGVLLFDRSRKPLAPTEIGEKVILQARRVIQEVNGIGALVTAPGESAGKLSIAVLPTIGQYLMPLLLPDFQSTNPNADLNITEEEAPAIVEGLRKGYYDVGILSTPLDTPELQQRKLYYEPMVAYVSPTHPLSAKRYVPIDALRNMQSFTTAPGTCFHNQLIELLGHAEFSSDHDMTHVRYIYRSAGLFSPMVEQMGTLAVLPGLAQHALPEGLRSRIRPIKGVEGVREISMLQSPLLENLHLADALEDTIRKVIPRKMQEHPKVTILHPGVLV